MKKKATIHEKKARIGTAIFTLLLLIYLFFFGLTYIDPAPEGGIAINFGYEEAGSGNTTAAPTPSESTPPTPVEQTPETVDDVVTQDVEDAPVVKEEEKPKPKEEEKPVDPEKEAAEKKRLEEEAKKKELDSRFNKISNQQDVGEGEGEKTGGGDQGDPDGDKNSKNRIGDGQGSGSGNYRLGGRGALHQPTPTYDCSEEGRVVVKVYVTRKGKVVHAVGGEQIPNGPASTTTSTCLLKRAKEAALKTTWAADNNAPEQQVGYIIYNFFKN